MKSRYSWRPLQRATSFKPPGEDLIAETMRVYSLDRADAIALIERDRDEVYVNDLYQVLVHERAEDGLIQLNIRRRDGGPILRDWRHFQAIKNQLLGEECEAVELYPAESRKVDQANKFHLFGYRDPAFRFPFGWQERNVDYSQRPDASPGLRQRPL